MDIEKLLGELRYERERLNAAIMAIERLVLSSKKDRPDLSKRRGRPPGSKNKTKRDEILAHE
jgi:hypothetical protein